MQLFCFSIAATSVFSQVHFYEDFNNGLGQFTSVDSDGDGYEWGISYAGDDFMSQDSVATSASWIYNGTAGVILYPDNWLISDTIDLTGATGNIELSWMVYAQDQSYAAENYTVYVDTTDSINGLTASTVTFNEVLTPSSGYMFRTLDVSAFAGKKVFIGFRHHNVNDEFRMNLDNIQVKTVEQVDIEMTAITSETHVQTGNSVDITGSLVNRGYDTVTALQLIWNDGTGDNIDTISGLSIALNQSYNFTHGIQLNVANPVAYNLTISVYSLGMNDSDSTNNSLTHSVNGLTFIPERKVVIEEGTGTWCGFCPRGAVSMEQMYADNSRPNFIGIAVHNNDPMEVQAYDNGANFSTFPGMNANRKLLGEGVSTQSMQAAYDQLSAETTYLEAEIANTTFNPNDNSFSIDVDVTFATQVTTEHRIGAIITENKVWGTSAGYNQVNYYDGGTYGPLSGAGIADWTTAGDPVYADQIEYQHVGRALIGGYDGADSSLTFPATAGSTQSYTVNGSLNGYNRGNCEVVIVVINSTSGEIMNAAKVAPASNYASIEETENTIDFLLYPNPASDRVQLLVSTNHSATSSTQIINSVGQVVMSNQNQTLTKGDNTLTLDVQQLPKGLYFVNVTVDDKTISKKLTIN